MDAIVLFDWPMSVDLHAIPITHPAEKQALADLLTRFEHETDLPGVTQEQIDAARGDVYRDMGCDRRRLKCLNVVDEHSLEAVAIGVRRPCTADDVVAVLVDLVASRGAAQHLRMDNGPR